MSSSEQDLHFNIEVDGQPVRACAGQTVAAALMAAGQRVLRHTRNGAPRGLFCGMGVCFDCLVSVDGRPNQRACMTRVRPGMRVARPVDQESALGND